MAKYNVSNYRLAPKTKADLKRFGDGNESRGIRLGLKALKELSEKKLRKLKEREDNG